MALRKKSHFYSHIWWTSEQLSFAHSVSHRLLHFFSISEAQQREKWKNKNWNEMGKTDNFLSKNDWDGWIAHKMVIFCRFVVPLPVISIVLAKRMRWRGIAMEGGLHLCKKKKTETSNDHFMCSNLLTLAKRTRNVSNIFIFTIKIWGSLVPCFFSYSLQNSLYAFVCFFFFVYFCALFVRLQNCNVRRWKMRLWFFVLRDEIFIRSEFCVRERWKEEKSAKGVRVKAEAEILLVRVWADLLMDAISWIWDAFLHKSLLLFNLFRCCCCCCRCCRCCCCSVALLWFLAKRFKIYGIYTLCQIVRYIRFWYQCDRCHFGCPDSRVGARQIHIVIDDKSYNFNWAKMHVISFTQC